MPELVDQMILYHGSYCEVQTPDLSKCSRYKDFGQGFYLTSSESQARSFAKTSTRKAMDNGIISNQGFGVVSSFRYSTESGLVVLDYPTANVDWLHSIVGHRRNRTFLQLVQQLKKYDVISGKIANDNTNVTITAYMQGIFGDVGSETADRICIGLLLPERLENQFCFRTSKALNTLSFLGSERVCL